MFGKLKVAAETGGEELNLTGGDANLALDDAFTSGVPGEHYDVLFYVQDSTPSVLLDVETPSSWAMWD